MGQVANVAISKLGILPLSLDHMPEFQYKRMRLFLLSVNILLSLVLQGQGNNFDDFCHRFVDNYKSLNIRPPDLSYVSGLEHIGTADSIRRQIEFFQSVRSGLSHYKIGQLTPLQRLDHRLIDYESQLNLERLSLEQEWVKNRPEKISTEGILTVPNGKAWYAWLLKRWVSAAVTPDEIFRFGLAEVKRVQQHIGAIRRQTGMSEDAFYKYLNDPSFFINDPAAIQDLFEQAKQVVYSHLHTLFTETKIPELKIERGNDHALAQTPGFYNDSTFYYNLFEKPYNTRQVGWLFIHEGVPGHHYQISISNQTKSSPVQKLFFYSGFVEGWAAYTEELGKQLGVYQTPYDELGKWEWDIVRSVRVPMDVGLNYYGWTNEQALAFWKKNIRNQDDIALREINRIRRWPAQVVTYKYGAWQIMRWKEELQRQQGKKFNIKDFHDHFLRQGSLPLFMMAPSSYATGS
jgi:uncharacterized protein (DUF885 family)